MTTAVSIAGVPLFEGEVLLSSWSETSKSGKTVTFALDVDSATGEHPFKGLGTGKYGQKFMLVAVPITDSGQKMSSPGASTVEPASNPRNAGRDDASPQSPQSSRAPGEQKVYTLANKIGMRCGEDAFQRWALGFAVKMGWSVGEAPADCAGENRNKVVRAIVRRWCGVPSRANITPGSEAAAKWVVMDTEYLRDTDQMAEARG